MSQIMSYCIAYFLKQCILLTCIKEDAEEENEEEDEEDEEDAMEEDDQLLSCATKEQMISR